MPNTLIDMGWDIYTNTCALLNNFCVQVQEKSRLSRRITLGFYTGFSLHRDEHVRKPCDKAPGLPLVSHSPSTAIFRPVTDIITVLSTLSTPPITTTTNIFI
jgi:hypothetical protein